MNENLHTHKISFYDRGKLSKPSGSIDRFEVYESIRTDFVEETLFIQNKYGAAIADGFPDGKNDYQSDKKHLLNACCFSGNIDRSNNSIFEHNCIINLDIDENTPDELKCFFSQVPNISFIESAARSVSHLQTGAFWLNAKIEIPTNWSCISVKLRNLLGLKREGKKELSYQNIETIHKAYHEALTYIFLKQGIKVGKAKDLKRVRYLTNDPDIYINPDAQVYTLNALELALLEIGKKDESKNFNRVATTINKSDAFEFAEEFATKSTGDYGDGNKHNYLVHFSIACNRLGVEKDKAAAYIESVYPDKRDGNFMSPFQKYSVDFGSWKYKIYKKDAKADYTFTIEKNQYLGDIKEKVFDIYADAIANEILPKFDWKAGVGFGKSTLVGEDLAPFLTDLTKQKVIFCFPLNSLTEQQAIKNNLKYLTGEVIDPIAIKEALRQDIIFCNNHYFNTIVKILKSEGKKAHIFFDESHDLINGTNYKFDVISEVWKNKESIAASITLMSGTPFSYFLELGFKRIDFKKKDVPKVKVYLNKLSDNTELDILNHCLNADKKKQVFTQYNNKRGIDIICDTLEKQGFEDKEDYLRFYSEEEIKKSEHYKKFIKADKSQNSFGHARFIFCTSFVNMGLSAYAKNVESVFVNNRYHHSPNSFVQFSARCRNNENREIYYYYRLDKLTIEEKIELTKSLIDNLPQGKELEKEKRILRKQIESIKVELFPLRKQLEEYKEELKNNPRRGLKTQIKNIGKQIKTIVKSLTPLEEELERLTNRRKYLIEKLEKLEVIKELQKRDYNYRYAFNQSLKYYQSRAKKYNEDLTNFRFEPSLRFEIKSEISESNFYYFDDNNNVCVNQMYLIKLINETYLRSMNLDKFKKHLIKNYPQFELIEKESELANDESLVADLKDSAEEETEKREEAQNKIYHLLTGVETDIFLQAVRLKTKDLEFKKLVPIDRLLIGEANKIIEGNPDVFGHYLCHAVTAWKIIDTFQKLHISFYDSVNLAFTYKASSGHYVLSHNKAYTPFLKSYKIQLLIYLYSLEKKREIQLLSTFQRNDAERYILFLDAIQKKAIENKISAKNILFTALDIWRKGSKKAKTGISQYKAVSIFKTLFNTKYSNHLYCIDDIVPKKNLESVLLSANIKSDYVIKSIEKSYLPKVKSTPRNLCKKLIIN